MRVSNGEPVFAPTDLANFLACRHKTALDLLVALGRMAKPTWVDPFAEILRRRGDEHERQYVDTLRHDGLQVVDLAKAAGDRTTQTLEAMRAGADVIVQAAVGTGAWLGYADVLRKVPVPSPALGGWSYEVQDTKLTRETRGGTILQLCVYTDLVGSLQWLVPEQFHVVTPIAAQSYRFDDFGAFYRQTRQRFAAFVEQHAGVETPSTYPEPVEHCAVCRWASRCNAQRRGDDHLSLVAGLGQRHADELRGQGVATLAALSELSTPIPFKPSRGAVDTYEKLRHQALLQARQRASGQPTFETLPIVPEFGLTRLPEPRPGDLFLDLEGDPFARPVTTGASGEGAQEYLFGLGRVEADGAFTYRARWAFTDEEERRAFDEVMGDIMDALAADPSIHIYHYAPYESSAFKRLMGRHVIREADVDRLLRGGRFVDLFAVVRHALRAGVESYSIKSLEPFYAFTREVTLEDAGHPRRLVEFALETDDLSIVTPDVRAMVEGYNRDDCRSVYELRRWLETLRQQQIDAGQEIQRPPLEPDAPSEDVSARQQRVDELRARLVVGVPPERGDRTAEEHARWLLAFLLDWHYREEKVAWWEYFRLRDLSDEDLLDEPTAVAGLEFLSQVDVVKNKKTGKPTGSVVDRYGYPPQECEIRERDTLKLRDDKTFGNVQAIDRVARTLDVKKGPSMADVHPLSAFAFDNVNVKVLAEALFGLGQCVAADGLGAAPTVAVDLLMGQSHYPAPNETEAASPAGDYAVAIAGRLGRTHLPIQGPPGAGKTFTGARMICELVAQGKRVGIAATSHKVIRNLLKAVAEWSTKNKQVIKLGHKMTEPGDDGPGIQEFTDNDEACDAIRDGDVHVLGGTAWLWSRDQFTDAVDVLFIDEAGQMSLANALAVSRAAASLVLLGDPQQLQQPQKGSHPDGVDVSALDHILQGHKTMPEERGLFLPTTWRLAPKICDFTSEVFYERRLEPKPGLERQRIVGSSRFDGAGLFVVDAAHHGCRNASDEEAELVAAIVAELLSDSVHWIDEGGKAQPVTRDDILIVAPYNAHVTRLEERLGAIRIGTVDKFQGQEAPIVIYSMATSRAEDAPRGMEFLYSLNRLNVATSRARCISILVASPLLFEPECRGPRQMQLANAVARYRELATDATDLIE
jgi:uncharacterized protein